MFPSYSDDQASEIEPDACNSISPVLKCNHTNNIEGDCMTIMEKLTIRLHQDDLDREEAQGDFSGATEGDR